MPTGFPWQGTQTVPASQEEESAPIDWITAIFSILARALHLARFFIFLNFLRNLAFSLNDNDLGHSVTSLIRICLIALLLPAVIVVAAALALPLSGLGVFESKALLIGVVVAALLIIMTSFALAVWATVWYAKIIWRCFSIIPH